MSEVPLYYLSCNRVWDASRVVGEMVRCFFFFFTLVTGPRRSLILKLSDTKVYEPVRPERTHVYSSCE